MNLKSLVTPLDRQVEFGEPAGPFRPMVLDVGGEGRHPHAWNLNLSHVKTVGPGKGQAIGRLILGRAEAIPVADESVDLVIVERTPLTREALREIARVVSRGGRIVLRHVPLPRRDRHALAASVLGRPPERCLAYIAEQLVQETTFLIE
ncbi:MAG: methyltransferase domain-containing protein [Pirellulales bacterium]